MTHTPANAIRDKILEESDLSNVTPPNLKNKLEWAFYEASPNEILAENIMQKERNPRKVLQIHGGLMGYEKLIREGLVQPKKGFRFSILNAHITIYHTELFLKYGPDIEYFFTKDEHHYPRTIEQQSYYAYQSTSFLLRNSGKFNDKFNDTGEFQKNIARKRSRYLDFSISTQESRGIEPRVSTYAEAALSLYSEAEYFPNLALSLLEKSIGYFNKIEKRESKGEEIFARVLTECGRSHKKLGEIKKDKALIDKGEAYISRGNSKLREHSLRSQISH